MRAGPRAPARPSSCRYFVAQAADSVVDGLGLHQVGVVLYGRGLALQVNRYLDHAGGRRQFFLYAARAVGAGHTVDFQLPSLSCHTYMMHLWHLRKHRRDAWKRRRRQTRAAAWEAEAMRRRWKTPGGWRRFPARRVRARTRW